MLTGGQHRYGNSVGPCHRSWVQRTDMPWEPVACGGALKRLLKLTGEEDLDVNIDVAPLDGLVGLACGANPPPRPVDYG